METDRREKDQVVKQLKSQETTLASEIRSKEKTRKQLQASLQTIIRRELEEARRKEKARLAALAKQEEERKRRLAEQQGATAGTNATDADKTATNDVASAPKYDPATTGLATVSRSDRSYSPFESTKEGLTLSLNFEGNKGRLPWPVSTGIVTAPFGSYEIPGTKLKGNSDGIDISLPVGSSVKAVADGEVSSVFDIGGEQAVVVRHGKYFTTYSHLSTVSVNKQDKVSAGTVIGKAAASDDGDGMLTFMVSNERGGFLNPEGWLKRR
jgi:murein DD-endopeptidase MepM/ murein hydrolase activator NlpD